MTTRRADTDPHAHGRHAEDPTDIPAPGWKDVLARNLAHDEDETRGFVERRGLALLFTLGAITFALCAGVGIDRRVVLFGGMLVALAILYRCAPDRDDPKWVWTSPGAIVATAVWLAASALLDAHPATS